ncbi:MAG: hypothetical protein ACRCTW_08155 [Lactococcus garvieae]
MGQYIATAMLIGRTFGYDNIFTTNPSPVITFSTPALFPLLRKKLMMFSELELLLDEYVSAQTCPQWTELLNL